jgi:PqqD family protein of HPr-rel-A system
MSWRRDPAVPFQKLEEDTIVVDPRTREVHLLNDTAGRIWDLLSSKATVEDLAARLGEEYEAPAEELRDAVTELLHDLRSKGLVLGDAPPRTER